jgi:hypothetical protein
MGVPLEVALSALHFSIAHSDQTSLSGVMRDMKLPMLACTNVHLVLTTNGITLQLISVKPNRTIISPFILFSMSSTVCTANNLALQLSETMLWSTASL